LGSNGFGTWKFDRFDEKVGLIGVKMASVALQITMLSLF